MTFEVVSRDNAWSARLAERLACACPNCLTRRSRAAWGRPAGERDRQCREDWDTMRTISEYVRSKPPGYFSVRATAQLREEIEGQLWSPASCDPLGPVAP